MKNKQDLELVPGVVPTPLFETDEAYKKFRDEFTDAVTPRQEEHRRALRASKWESFFRMVD
jgi:hypothetical protein